MQIKIFTLVFIGLLTFSQASIALECQVEYKAKRVTEKSKWYGRVETPEFKSGVASGVGENNKLCEEDALRPIKADGWQITYHKLRQPGANNNPQGADANEQTTPTANTLTPEKPEPEKD